MPSHEDVERAIRSVPGVAAASVGRAQNSGRGRLRIRLHPGEDAERVSWSVAATLRERFGIALDPEEIRPRLTALTVEEVEEGPEPESEPEASSAEATCASAEDVPSIDIDREGGERAAEPAALGDPQNGDRAGAARFARPWRPTIRDLGSRTDGVTLTVTAALEFEGRTTAGEATGTPTTRGLHRAIAEATIRAIGKLTQVPLRAQVDRVTVGGGDPASVTVVVSLLSGHGEELLLGGSLVRGDVEHAIMRASLDALNRRVEPNLALDA